MRINKTKSAGSDENLQGLKTICVGQSLIRYLERAKPEYLQPGREGTKRKLMSKLHFYVKVEARKLHGLVKGLTKDLQNARRGIKDPELQDVFLDGLDYLAAVDAYNAEILHALKPAGFRTIKEIESDRSERRANMTKFLQIAFRAAAARDDVVEHRKALRTLNLAGFLTALSCDVHYGRNDGVKVGLGGTGVAWLEAVCQNICTS